MRLVQFLSLVMLGLMISCKDAPQRPEPILDEGYQPATNQTSSPNTIQTTNENVTSSVYHYICPNGCGGGDAAGNCPVCGSAYTHNQAFHNQTGAQTTPANPVGNANVTSSPTQTAEPAQNAAGVWHFTCPNGCEGGGGSAVACGSCGTTLVHNSLYHQ